MPNMAKQNLRNLTVSTETGKDFRDTKVLSGESGKTPGESARNETVQYMNSGGNKKTPLGGKNTNS